MRSQPLSSAESLAWGALGLGLFLGLWTLLSVTGIVPRQFLPPPYEVAARFVELTTNPFAEFVRIPQENIVEIPDGLSTVKAALAEPMAVAYHAVQLGLRLSARPATGLTCAAVLGGGAIGLCAALVLAMAGVASISVGEPNAARRASAEQAGPFRAFEPGAPGAPADASADLVIDAVGADRSREAACRLVRAGGAIVHIGLLPESGGVDVRKITLQEVSFVGSYCYTMVEFRETVAALASGRLGALDWFEERALEDGARAFADLDAGRTAAAKIILRPS